MCCQAPLRSQVGGRTPLQTATDNVAGQFQESCGDKRAGRRGIGVQAAVTPCTHFVGVFSTLFLNRIWKNLAGFGSALFSEIHSIADILSQGADISDI